MFRWLIKFVVICIIAYSALKLIFLGEGAEELIRGWNEAVKSNIKEVLSAAIGGVFSFIRFPSPSKNESPMPSLTLPKEVALGSDIAERYDILKEWAPQAEGKIAALNRSYSEAYNNEQVVRIGVLGAFLMAVGSCAITFIFPPGRAGIGHAFIVIAAYCVPAIFMGILLHFGECRSGWEVTRLGFVTPFFINTMAILIFIGYSHKKWFETNIFISASISINLAAMIAFIRLVAIPIFCAAFCILGWQISKVFFRRGNSCNIAS